MNARCVFLEKQEDAHSTSFSGIRVAHLLLCLFVCVCVSVCFPCLVSILGLYYFDYRSNPGSEP